MAINLQKGQRIEIGLSKVCVGHALIAVIFRACIAHAELWDVGIPRIPFLNARLVAITAKSALGPSISISQQGDFMNR